MISDIASRLNYDPETGLLTWAEDVLRNGVVLRPKGSLAGCLNKKLGYIVVRSRGKNYYAQRIAWFVMTGEEPPTVDHKNGDRADNRWMNLRSATRRQNTKNRKNVVGAHKAKGAKNWTAYITVDYRRQHLGQFATEDEARAAHDSASLAYFGDFSGAI